MEITYYNTTKSHMCVRSTLKSIFGPDFLRNGNQERLHAFLFTSILYEDQLEKLRTVPLIMYLVLYCVMFKCLVSD